MEPGSFQLPSNSARGIRHILKLVAMGSIPTAENTSFTVNVTKRGKRLLREVVESPSVEIFKA